MESIKLGGIKEVKKQQAIERGEKPEGEGDSDSEKSDEAEKFGSDAGSGSTVDIIREWEGDE